jgi:hypothetical protein
MKVGVEVGVVWENGTEAKQARIVQEIAFKY